MNLGGEGETGNLWHVLSRGEIAYTRDQDKNALAFISPRAPPVEKRTRA